MNESIIRSRLAALVVLIAMGVAAFAAFPPGVAVAEASGEPLGMTRHEPVAEPDLPGDTEDHARRCDSERDEWSSSPRGRPLGETECPQSVSQAAPSDWDCCEDDDSQEQAEESTDADERGDRSPELEDEDFETSGDDVDPSEPILAPPHSDGLDADEDVPLVDDDPTAYDVSAGSDGPPGTDLPVGDGVPPSDGVSPSDGLPPSDGVSPMQPGAGQVPPIEPPAVNPPLDEPTPPPVDQVQVSGADLPLLDTPQVMAFVGAPPTTLSMSDGPIAVTDEGLNVQPTGGGTGVPPNPLGRENTAHTPGPQGAPSNELPGTKPADGEGLFGQPLSEYSILALPAGLCVVLLALWVRKPHQWYDTLRRANLGVRRAMLGELADDVWDRTSDGYHEAAAHFAGTINGENGGEQNLVVLAADGDAATLRLIESELTARGLAVVPVRTGGEALIKFGQSRPDIVLLAGTMPDIDQAVIMETLQGSGVPVIFLMEGNEAAERVRALDLGADDCLSKPFDASELAARMRAVNRRTNRGYRSAHIVRFHDLQINLARRTVQRNGDLLELTPTEWRLLEYLITNSGRLVLKEEILDAVWGPEYRDATDYLRVWVPLLRRRLGSRAAQSIKTVRGLGYVVNLLVAEPGAKRGAVEHHASPQRSERLG